MFVIEKTSYYNDLVSPQIDLILNENAVKALLIFIELTNWYLNIHVNKKNLE